MFIFAIIRANRLTRIFSIGNLGNNLIQKSTNLTYTPRRLVKHPDQPYFYIVESENNTLAPELRAKLLADSNVNGDSNELSLKEFGYPRCQGNGHPA